MLSWNIGVDWGFYGYLGASSSAWSYDPSSGDVVTQTESIEGGLNTLKGPGIVHLDLDLPLSAVGTAMFTVNGKSSNPIPLPESSVVVIAACLLRQNQEVTLTNFKSKPY